MANSSSFKVVNASAGSGKTYTLVKAYLKILLNSSDPGYFKNILAVTFTNKAATEMKERVIASLINLIDEVDLEDELLISLENELGIDKAILTERAKKVLHSILQNYSAFNISTLDSFTYRLVRSFAFDLGLSVNFDVELDAIGLLNEAVDELISKIGIDSSLTQLLIDFSLQKANDDKSWDISRELKDIARLLLKENDARYVAKIKDRPIRDFIELKEQLTKKQREIKSKFKRIGNDGLNIITSAHIDKKAFSHAGELPNHFNKLANGQISDLKFEGRLNKNIESNYHFHAGKASQEDKNAIDEVVDPLIALYQESKTYYGLEIQSFNLNRLILKNLIPLAVLSKIKASLEEIKASRNVHLNAEFNSIVSQNLQSQPAAFIYERLGDKFRHFFIDEMQDTSILQWKNLIPLIHNTLSEEGGSLLLVGDVKQSIYRWRGSEPEQFLKLAADGSEKQNNPFFVEKNLDLLETNYRSYSEVINFNNGYFKHLAKFFKRAEYGHIYTRENQQQLTGKTGGFIEMFFVESGLIGEDKDLAYAEKVYKVIQNCRTSFQLGEICVLVRKKRQGIAIANYLSKQQIEVVSSETLLIQNSAKVNFVIDLLAFLNNPKDQSSLFNALYFLYDSSEFSIEKDHFFTSILSEDLSEVFLNLKPYNFEFKLNDFQSLALFESVEYILRSFNLNHEPDAYVLYFLEEVYNFSKLKSNLIADFLEHWELKKDLLSIVVPENNNAVQIMTIHKSKGLEFPVVIYPYDLLIYENKQDQVWYPTASKEEYNGFEHLLVNQGSQLAQSGEMGEHIFEHLTNEQEFDNFNLLYVAFTRAIEQLYIVGEHKKKSNELKSSSQFMQNYLEELGLWNSSENEYSFGDQKRISITKSPKIDVTYLNTLTSTSWESHKIVIAAQHQWLKELNDGAIEYGLLIHEMLASVLIEDDVLRVVNQYILLGRLEASEKTTIQKTLNSIVNHELLAVYFQPGLNVLCEREIITEDGQTIIPDRLILYPDKAAVIIDYKTGNREKSHENQLRNYAKDIGTLGFSIAKLLLVYIDESIEIKEVD